MEKNIEPNIGYTNLLEESVMILRPHCFSKKITTT